MSLEPASSPDRLYLAVGDDVNLSRPLFTGDVFDRLEIPGVGETAGILVGHPCSIRGRGGALQSSLPIAAVEPHDSVPDDKWISGYLNRMALPGLPLDHDFHVAWLDRFGLVAADEVKAANRVACLSHPGINQLQQRLVFHQTRLEVPTGQFQAAFDHTYEEADLLEEWVTDLVGDEASLVGEFESWIQEGDPSRQDRLKAPQERAPLRREMRAEIRRRTT